MMANIHFLTTFTCLVLHLFCQSASSSDSLDHAKDDSHISLNEPDETSLCSSMGGVVALGMQSGAVPDQAISASSSYNEQSVGPQYARLHQDKSGGAWCPAPQLSDSNSGKEWLQVNLTHTGLLFVISTISTQGRFGNGMGVEFTEQFWIEYSRDGKSWHKWRGRDGNHELQGNEDTYNVMRNELTPPIVGVNVIRIFPKSQHLRTVCLRLELFGCPYEDGPLSYSMPDGVSGRFGDLFDKTYDGDIQLKKENSLLSGGLGQLVDGIKGEDNYKANKGFEWIGWRSNPGSNGDIVSIIFEYADVRNFTLASFHCNNMFSKDMEVFASAKIWFSLDGRKWSNVPEDFEYMPDHIIEHARDVVIHLHHRIGRLIKFDLKLASKWLLISEVRIASVAVNKSHRLDLAELDSIRSSNKSFAPAAINNNRSLIRESFLLVVFSVLGMIITVSVVFYIVHVRRRKGKLTGVDYVTMSMKDVATTPLYCEPRDVNRSMSPFPGAAGAPADPEYAVPDVIGGSPPTTTTFVPANATVNNSNNQPQQQQQQRYYASADLLNRNIFTDFGNYHYAATVANAYHPNNNKTNSSHYEESSAISSPSQDHQPTSLPPTLPQTLPNIDEKDVSLLKNQIGYSRFGDVALGQFNDNLVILKALQNDECRQEFFAEMAEKLRLSSACDYFAKFYGFVNSPDCMTMVIEHGDCDLRQFLKNANQHKLGYQTLIYIVSEIANAMHQLQSMGFVHRDLAARNCLIYTSKLLVKITDSGAFISDYKDDYYKEVLPIRWMAPESILKGRFTPKSDVYSFGVTFWEILTFCRLKPFAHLNDDALLKTVLQLSNGKSKNGTYYRHPFESANDHRQQLILPKPDACPKEIYDLMAECWEKNEKARPEFREICVFLQRKNLGFQKPTQ